jgi:hypothetical protein
VLAEQPRVRINPDPPDVNFFALHLEGDAEGLMQRHHALAARTGTFLFSSLTPDTVPGFCRTEVHCWENAAAADLARVAAFIEELTT